MSNGLPDVINTKRNAHCARQYLCPLSTGYNPHSHDLLADLALKKSHSNLPGTQPKQGSPMAAQANVSPTERHIPTFISQPLVRLAPHTGRSFLLRAAFASHVYRHQLEDDVRKGRIEGVTERRFDDCFESGDADAVLAVLFARAERDGFQESLREAFSWDFKRRATQAKRGASAPLVALAVTVDRIIALGNARSFNDCMRRLALCFHLDLHANTALARDLQLIGAVHDVTAEYRSCVAKWGEERVALHLMAQAREEGFSGAFAAFVGDASYQQWSKVLDAQGRLF